MYTSSKYVNAKGKDVETAKEVMATLPPQKGDKLNWFKYEYYRHRDYVCKSAKTKDGYYFVNESDGYVFCGFVPIEGITIIFSTGKASREITVKASITMCNKIHAGDICGVPYDYENYLKRGKYPKRPPDDFIQKQKETGEKWLNEIDEDEWADGKRPDTPYVLDHLHEQPLMTRNKQIRGANGKYLPWYVCRGPKEGEGGSLEDYSDISDCSGTSMKNAKIYVMVKINQRKYPYNWFKEWSVNRKLLKERDPSIENNGFWHNCVSRNPGLN